MPWNNGVMHIVTKRAGLAAFNEKCSILVAKEDDSRGRKQQATMGLLKGGLRSLRPIRLAPSLGYNY
jgi:hypothetical protein